MVNKCSLIGCKSLYAKKDVKLHRFPLTRQKILPLWIAFTGKNSSWVPGQSSRLCRNHFIKSDYIMNHKKGILKPIAVPSIKHRVESPRKRRKNGKLYPIINQFKNLNKFIQVEHIVEQENDKTFHDQKASYQGNGHVNIICNKYSRCVCNRKNQCYKLTESLKKNHQPIIPTFEGSTNFENLPSSRYREQLITSDDVLNIEIPLRTASIQNSLKLEDKDLFFWSRKTKCTTIRCKCKQQNSLCSSKFYGSGVARLLHLAILVKRLRTTIGRSMK